MFVQDWTPVVFKKKNDSEKTKKYSGPTHLQKLDEHSENYKNHKKVSKVFADAIKQKGNQLRMTQEQLAQKVNVRSNIINDIESQRGNYDHVVIEKIKRVLGITKKNIIIK